MPPKIKVPDGELTSTELRKLIRGHNILVTIKIPKGTDRDGLIALIKSKGYKVDHKKKAIIDSKADRPRRPQVTLEKAKELTKPKPVSEEEKKKRQQARQKKKGEKAFLKVAIPKAPPVSKKPSKVIKVGKPPPMKAKTPAPKAKAKTPVESGSVDFAEIKKILKDSKYNFRKSESIKEGKLYMGTNENNIDKLIQDTDKLFKNNPLVYNNVVFMTDSYPPNPKTGEQDGVYRKPKTIYQGKILGKAKTPAPKAKTPAPKAKTPKKDTPVKITKKVSLNDFLKNLTKISNAPDFIKIRDTMTDDEIIKRFNNTNDWKRFDVPIQKRLGKLLGFKL
tara:strand:+ start:13757 stop:14761 length:1005 start_codon:yes stop_codon:yes gene_type:complete